MFNKVKNYVNKNNLINKNDYVIVGVSGGSDSMLLLSFLLNLKKDLNFDLKVIHINHGLRGIESDGDEKLVADFCKENSVPYKIYHCDIKKLKQELKTSEEDAGRIFRYQCFHNEFLKNRNNKIAVAHNKSDCIETFFINLFRGASMNGLTGIKEKSQNIIRPILFLSKNEIENYCKNNNVPFRVDSSNANENYTRNKIRQNLLPKIKKEYNPNIENTIIRTMDLLREEDSFIQEYAKTKFSELCQIDNGKIKILRDEFLKNHIVIKKRILLLAINKIKGDCKDIESKHIQNAIDLIDNNKTGKKTNLPSSIELSISYRYILVEKNSKNEKNSFAYELLIDKPLFIKELGLYVTLSKTYINDFLGKNNCYTKIFCYDIINGSLKIRSRLNGDKIYLSKINGHKKVKSIFIDDKIDQNKRDEIPLVTINDRIIWIVNKKDYFDTRYSPIHNNEKIYIQIWED